MRKQFVKVMLFCVLALTASATFVGCKDYDDDIDALWEAVDGKVTPEQLQAKVDNLQSALDQAKQDLATVKSNAEAAKTAADAAKTAADAAKAAADAAGNKADAAKAAADAAAAAAAAAASDAILKSATAKAEAIAEAQKKVDALKLEVEAKIADINTALAQKATKEEMEAKFRDVLNQLDAKAAAVATEISNLLGHRLTSVVRIPNIELNDEPAIVFKNVTYIPQIFDKDHIAYTLQIWQDQTGDTGRGEVTKDVTGKARLYVDGKATEVKYQLNPKMGVRTSDFTTPYFMCDIQTNHDLKSRAVDESGRVKVGENSPIMATMKDYDANSGILTVTAVKNVIASDGTNITNSENINFTDNGSMQKYYMASLRVPIAPELYTKEEKDNGDKPEVASEYSRIAELTVVPMIKQIGAAPHPDHSGTHVRQQLLNGRNTNGQYVHYHDSVSLYTSTIDQMVDHQVQWDKGIDLKTLVTVCEFENIYTNGSSITKRVGSHDNLSGAADDDMLKSNSIIKKYGLTYRFALAGKSYMQGSNQTDQQKFAEIDNPINGRLSSRVYDVGGITQTALGREPIVRVMLMDTVNHNLVAQRYLKLKFVNRIEDITLAPYTFPDDIVTCKRHVQLFGTQPMNELLYRELEDYGLSKNEFHSIYKSIEIMSCVKDPKADGTGGTNLLVSPITWSVLDDTYNLGTGILATDADAYAMNNIAVNSPGDSQNQDIIFAMVKDQNLSNMSYNLKWYMSPRAIGKISRDADASTGSSTYIIKIKFKDPNKLNADVIKTFKQTVVIPAQAFGFESVYWSNIDWDTKTAIGAGKIYNVNPSVYVADRDFQSFGAYPWFYTWNTGKDRYNHIGADFMEGFKVVEKDNMGKRPANLAQFIKNIRSCAEVRFEFDDAKFGKKVAATANVPAGDYSHLNGYKVNDNRQSLWNIPAPFVLGAAQLATYDHRITTDARYDNLAATISNKFGATAVENKKNLLWDKFDETLESGVNEASAQINLSEISASKGSAAAINLIGKDIPMQLIVEYNEYNEVPVLNFKAHIMDPLKTPTMTGYFDDAKVNGSFINVQDGLTLVDWNNYVVSRNSLTAPADPKGLKYDFVQRLYDYYQVESVVYDVANSTTNIKQDGNVWKPVWAGEGEEQYNAGVMPSGRMLKQQWYWGGAYHDAPQSGAAINATHLGYFNNSGTPVNEKYEIYLGLDITYKWGVKKGNVGVLVYPSDPLK